MTVTIRDTNVNEDFSFMGEEGLDEIETVSNWMMCQRTNPYYTRFKISITAYTYFGLCKTKKPFYRLAERLV